MKLELMVWSVGFCWLLLPFATAQEPLSKPWVYSLTLRGWSADAGHLTASGRGQSSRAIAPELMLHARKGPVMARILHALETNFDGLRNGSDPQRLRRKDSEMGLGYFWTFEKAPLALEFWGGYKNLEVVLEDIRVASEDIWTYRGWQVGSTSTWETQVFGLLCDLSLNAGYAFFETRVHQRIRQPLNSDETLFHDPYAYHARGIFLDAAVTLYLRPHLKWYAGYKSQSYNPTTRSANAVYHVPGFEPAEISVGTYQFSSQGVLAGFVVSF